MCSSTSLGSATRWQTRSRVRTLPLLLPSPPSLRDPSQRRLRLETLRIGARDWIRSRAPRGPSNRRAGPSAPPSDGRPWRRRGPLRIAWRRRGRRGLSLTMSGSGRCSRSSRSSRIRASRRLWGPVRSCPRGASSRPQGPGAFRLRLQCSPSSRRPPRAAAAADVASTAAIIIVGSALPQSTLRRGGPSRSTPRTLLGRHPMRQGIRAYMRSPLLAILP